MRCSRCGTEIEENEAFCDECKKVLKSVSNRSEVRELEEAIEDNKLLNEEEDTKELFDIETLNDKLEESEEIDNSLSDDKIEETRVEKYRNNGKNKKKVVIIIVISLVILIISLILVLLFTSKKDEEEVKVNYKNVLNVYGKKVEKELESYEELPEWDELIKNIEYEYKIECKVHEIYEDKKIYLDKCTIDKEKVNYIYGAKQKEEEDTLLTIYKNNNIYNTDSGDLIGTIKCEDKSCEFMTGFDKYAIVKEKNVYNLYEYNKEEKVFGPFNDMTNIIYIDNTLYGIYYTDGNNKNIYSLVSNKLFERVSGSLLLQDENFDPTLMYKYGLVILKDNNYNFVSLKTGRVNYYIEDKILKFVEDKDNKITYILTYKNDINKFKVINSNGKELFDGELNYFKLNDETIVVSNDTQFRVYDRKLNLNVSSKKYGSIVSIYDDFAIVMDNSVIKLVDLQDNLLAQFDLEIKNEIDKEKTGWNTIDGKIGIFIVFKGTDTKLFYDSKTGEMELIQK